MADPVTTIDETGFEKKWRPAMAWMYMCVCIFDFIIAPVFWTAIQFAAHGAGQVAEEWKPLTLIGGGLFHVAMGAVLGITSFGRTREKLSAMTNAINNGGDQNGDGNAK